MSTLELLIAFTILTLTLAAVVIVSFSNQTLVLDTQTNIEAVTKAQANLEVARALARQNFDTVASQTYPPDGIYSGNLVVTSLDDFTKSVTSNITWARGGRTLGVQQTTILTNPTSSGAACNLSISDPTRWKYPQVLNSGYKIDIAPNTLTDIAVVRTHAFITGFHTGSQPDFFPVDVADPTHPLLGTPLDTGLTGANAVAVAGNYAYVAANSTASQLQVIDISDPMHPSLVTAASRKVTGAGGVGKAIYYYNKTIYLGLTKSGGGPQVVAYNVTSPTNPVPLAPASGYVVGHNVNRILVKGTYVYVAHPESSADPHREQITVLNGDPSSAQFLTRIGGFYSSGASGGNGKSLFLSGTTLYLGRTASNLSGVADAVPEFFMLDNSIPPNINATPIGSLPLFQSGDGLNGMTIRGTLAFFTTNDFFQIWDISNPATISPWTANGTTNDFTTNPVYRFGGTGTAVGCSGNLIYIAATGPSGGSGHDVLTVIGPGAL